MERPNERLARYVVHEATGLPVTRFEDGKAPSQVDALISAPEGPMPLEIVAQHDSAFNKQWDALSKHGHELSVPGLKRRWVVQLARKANVKRVAAQLPSLMVEVEAEWPQERRRSMTYDLPEPLSELGIQILYPLDTKRRPGTVSLRAEGQSGFTNPDPISTFVESVLSEAPDVAAKLAAHPGEQKHAFIWATSTSDFSVQYALERREEQPLPTAHPQLPEGVTHVWVAGSMTSQGVVAWFPDVGWWRPEWRIPDVGPIDLGDFD